MMASPIAEIPSGSARQIASGVPAHVRAGWKSYCESMWHPNADDQVREEVFPKRLSQLVELDQGPDHHVWITVDEHNVDHQKRLEVIKFCHDASDENGKVASVTIATLPPLILYPSAQKQIISTFVTSGIKG